MGNERLRKMGRKHGGEEQDESEPLEGKDWVLNERCRQIDIFDIS